jgi:hypothetical protein
MLPIKEIIQLIPTINKALDLVTMGVKGLYNGIRGLVWKIGIERLKRKKEKINEATTPSDFTSLIN